jgi:hypothetical protein
VTPGITSRLTSGITPSTFAGVSTEGKARENRLRRAAGRQGYRLAKNPRRDPRAVGFGSYQITDPRTGAVVATFGWDERPGEGDRLAEAEAWLLERPLI